jgi:hypothetical protein
VHEKVHADAENKQHKQEPTAGQKMGSMFVSKQETCHREKDDEGDADP